MLKGIITFVLSWFDVDTDRPMITFFAIIVLAIVGGFSVDSLKGEVEELKLAVCQCQCEQGKALCGKGE